MGSQLAVSTQLAERTADGHAHHVLGLFWEECRTSRAIFALDVLSDQAHCVCHEICCSRVGLRNTNI